MKFEKSISIAELAKIIGADVKGGKDVEITGMNEIHIVEEGDITFVDNRKYYDKALISRATAIIIDKDDVDCPDGKVLLFSKDPLMAFNRLTSHFMKFIPSEKAIAGDVEIGAGTIIQPNVFVGNNVKIGKNSLIHSNVSIYDNTIIGDDVIIHSCSVLGADALYFQRREDGWHKFLSSGRTVIGNDVEIGANCAVDKGVTGDTTIGDGTKLDNFVHVGHDTVIGKRCLIGAQVGISGVCIIEDDVTVWGQSGINKSLHIGKGAVVLGTSAVDKDLEGGKVYFGVPAIEARKKWRELAALRQLPEILEKLPLYN
ncbi:MAG: UDP-3-O-(3-hydroxymyristoyl)glucosamine N-acyltransferase [Bacteroidales bacterium]|jgi:UDP-3-O-[3-hydroxymyristoyl] glucosamine N-acyltransferase|nr:UDP-3-O-(3-hydroxymyristoyl)glucosamine N-acyltransferase [Bacteroidales bacterium]